MAKGLRVVDLTIPTCAGIRLAVTPGQSLGLTGPSGAGKSLLLRALADLDDHQGQMWLDDVPSDAIPACQWRRQVGLLPAESAWWHDTVGPHLTDASAQAISDLGFDTQVLDWHVSRLSSGERQRLAVLRLLVNRPRVLLLDEPTANLDRENTTRVERLLGQYQKSQGAAMIWVSHDVDQLHRLCSRIYTFHEKQLKPLGASVPQRRGGK